MKILIKKIVAESLPLNLPPSCTLSRPDWDAMKRPSLQSTSIAIVSSFFAMTTTKHRLMRLLMIAGARFSLLRVYLYHFFVGFV